MKGLPSLISWKLAGYALDVPGRPSAFSNVRKQAASATDTLTNTHCLDLCGTSQRPEQKRPASCQLSLSLV